MSSALAGVHEAQAAVTEMQDHPRGVVRLAAPSDWSGWILAPIVAMFVERYPEIRIDLSLTDRHIDLVRDGFDSALTAGPLADSALIVRTIETIESGLFASQSYLDRRGTPATVDELRGHAFVLRRPGPTNRLQVTSAGGTETVVVSGAVATDDRGFVYEAVRAGLGIGVLPRQGCATHLGLVPVLPDHRLPGFTTHVVYPASRHIPQRVALFRDFLLEQLDTRGDGACGQAARTHGRYTQNSSLRPDTRVRRSRRTSHAP